MSAKWPYRTFKVKMFGISSVTAGWALTKETEWPRKPLILQKATRSQVSGKNMLFTLKIKSLAFDRARFNCSVFIYFFFSFLVRNIFQSRTSTGFRDEHIWVSIVDPPSRSPFTRAQRVSCCMSLLLCTMAINIAFWNIPVDPNSAVVVSIGGCIAFNLKS